LLFSDTHYLRTADAYLRALERRRRAGLDLAVPSVASVFISRWDSAADPLLPSALHGSLGLAMAQKTYASHVQLLSDQRWQALAGAGARPQRVLWASTSTKNPDLPDTYYLGRLAAPDTIDTVPEETLLAFADHGSLDERLEPDYAAAERAIAAAADTLPAELRGDARLVFTAHSVPVAADRRCGPQLYSRQVAYATRLVAAAAGYADYDLTWQSRSGPPQVPWLEPDVASHLTALGAVGAKAVIVCPIGFVADHIEVVWDLDQELASQAAAAGVVLTRAATPNAHPRFARLAADLIDELRYGRAPARVTGPDPVPGCAASINGEPCRPPHCVAEEPTD